MTYFLPLSLVALTALAACGSTGAPALTGATNCPQLDAQAQSVMVGTASNPLRCGPQQGFGVMTNSAVQGTVIATTPVAPQAGVATVTPTTATAQPLVIVPNAVGPAPVGQISQVEADFLAAEGVPATQENIDFLRLALQ